MRKKFTDLFEVFVNFLEKLIRSVDALCVFLEADAWPGKMFEQLQKCWNVLIFCFYYLVYRLFKSFQMFTSAVFSSLQTSTSEGEQKFVCGAHSIAKQRSAVYFQPQSLSVAAYFWRPHRFRGKQSSLTHQQLPPQFKPAVHQNIWFLRMYHLPSLPLRSVNTI